MSSVNRPKNPCNNPRCGNTLFTAEYDYSVIVHESFDRPKPVWKCTNCSWMQPRTSRNRPTNKSIALDCWREIKAEWLDTDAAVDGIVKAGHPSGALLVHTSTWNYHLDKLVMLKKPSRFDIKYHASGARRDLECAKLFVKEQNWTR